ncbi:MAG: LptE family protein, partial [Bdellovibrionota bacterium]
MILLAFALSACSYRVGDQERDIPGGYRTVAVPVFKNKTMETGIEVFFTNAIIREFERSRIGRVTDRASSQTTLEGEISSVEYMPSTEISNSNKPGGQ